MYKFFLLLLSMVLVTALALPSVLTAKETKSRKIVVFASSVSDTDRDELLASIGGNKLKRLSLIGAETVELPSSAEKELKRDRRVLRIDEDVQVDALAQVLPWGVDRVDAELVWPSGDTANPVKVGVIGTGISNKHSDLLANVKGGVNTINSRKGWNDDNGHGSHVAGIVGALNNEIGVVGAAPSVDLYAIKVLGANGSGWLSDIIEGIQWAVANNMQVINMSLGTSSNIQSFHDAVIAAKNDGL